MRVVLTPLGVVVTLSLIAVLLWLVVADKVNPLFKPTGAPIVASGKIARPDSSGKPNVAGVITSSARDSGEVASVDLSRVGATDWMIYGVVPGVLPKDSAVRKQVGSPRIGSLKTTGKGVLASYGNDPRSFRWSDGAGDFEAGEDVRTGLVTAGVGSGFRVTVTPQTGKRHAIKVWVGGTGVRSKLQARLSNGAPLSKVVESFQNIGTNGEFAFRNLYTIYFTATKPEQKLVLSFIVAEEGYKGVGRTGSGSLAPARNTVSLQAIALN